MRDWQRVAFGTRNRMFGTVYQPVVLVAVAILLIVIASYVFAAVVFALAALSFVIWWMRRGR